MGSSITTYFELCCDSVAMYVCFPVDCGDHQKSLRAIRSG